MIHTSTDGSAARTAADLDEMDNKLRRLGLNVDHPTTTPPALSFLAAHNSADYIHSIRAAKAEKQQERLDRSARLAAAVEKQQSSSAAAAMPLTAGTVPGASTVDRTAAGDKALLASDAADAALWVTQKWKSDRAQQLDAERMLKAAADRQQSRTENDQLPSVSPSSSMVPLSLKATAPKWRERKRQEAAVWCERVARGLAELAMEVSDNRHLPATGLDGRPVYRLHQDLSVTQWRQWVEQLVFPESFPTAAAENLRCGDGGAAGTDSEVAIVSPSRSADAPQQTVDADLQLEAAKCIESATEAEAQEAVQAQTEAVTCVLAQLHAEVARQRKAAEEAVRQAADEANLSASLTAESGVDVAGTPRREELLPGWAQRMPPAACFVYGDDLSGVRLLANTVDLCALRKLYQQQQATTHSPHRRLPSSHQGLLGAGESAEPTASDFPSTAPSAAAPPKDPLSLFVVSEIGVESSDPALTDGGAVATYVTPRTLLGSGGLAAVGGDGKRSGSAGRSQRTQPHSSAGGGNAVGGGSAAQGTAASAASGTNSGAAHRFCQRLAAMSSDGRRESDQLIDAIVREVVRVHRHNLGVLAGDRMPSWTPKPAAAGLGVIEEESSHPSVAALASVPLRTLFLVGFPDSASFAEALARRLKQATAAAEMELMDMEGRRRLTERQAAVAAAAAAEGGRQRSPSPAKGTKGASPGLARSKGSRLAKNLAGAEEQAVSAIVEELQATVAMPPLGVLATFLVYDLPTRQRRLEAASFATDAAPAQRASGDDGEDDLSASVGVGGAGVLRTVGPEYSHPVYNPPAEDIQSCGSLSVNKELAPTLTTGVRRGGPSGTSSLSFSLFPLFTASAPTVATSAASLCVHTWNIERLRTELKQQHSQQHRQRQDWTAAVVDNGKQGSADHLVGVQPGTTTFPRHSAKRRDKPTASPSTNFVSAPSDLERASAGARRVSVAAAARAAELSGAAALVKLSEEKGLPRVLFFVRVQDVSDPTAPSTTSLNCPLNPQSLGTAIWRATATSQHLPGNAPHRFAESRARTVNELTAQLRLLCCPAAGRVLTNESLAPRQLAEPFRLGDYRLAEATCAKLKETNKAFRGTLPAMPAPQSFEWSVAPRGAAVAIAARDALAAEAEVWATVMQYSEQLYHLVAKEVFTDGSAQSECPAVPPAAATLNTAARFTRIDQSYARAKEAITAHTAYAVPHLEDCLALLLRFSVDLCLGQLAASVRLLCESVSRHHRMEAGALGASTSVSASNDKYVDEELLSVAPRLSLDAARALIDSLRSVDARETSATLLAELAKVYWPQVTAAAAKVAVQHFKSSSLQNLAGAARPSTTSTPQPQPQTQAITDKSESAGDSDAGTTAQRQGANIMAEEHIPAAVQLLLEHAINAPAPMARVALLLQESQRMVAAARDGADAWVELLYREVLGMHTAAPFSTVPRVRRPCSLDELADGPLAVLRTDDDDAANLPRPSPWRCGQLELLLSSVRPTTPKATVPTERLERGLLVHQLQRLWRFLPDISAELAAKAKYSMFAHEATAPVPAACMARPVTFASAAPGPLALPDTSLDAYLLSSCPCRPSFELRFPFLTTADVKCLSSAAAAEAASTVAVARPAVMDLELWLANLALHRCCFCTKWDASAAEVGGGDSELAPVQTSRCTRPCASMPSSGAVRHTIVTLPACVLSQHATFCSTATTPLPPPVTIPPPSPSEMPAEWVFVQWWWRASREEGTWSQAEDVQRCYALWRILLGHVPPPPLSVAESAVSTPPTMAPLLPTLLRLLVGIGRRVGATEERVRRAFHCLAALRRVRANELDTGADAVEEDAEVDAAVSTEDEMTLTVDECAALGRLLSSTPHTVSSSLSPRTASTTGAEAAAAEATPEIEIGGHEFMTDVQLLLQVEGTKGVTLPLLLSSRWASLLIREHF
ncbi:hypothetical protein LSCM1_06837 [Leishmania martiniquensis]|uniref:Uncharacterized protein n=1 Tax=Leishmania martiniquensis TaxID=1580590 RepID=A0A836HAY6_9TRYP|nr:hypothetical protein LSCM1_06837 [Leishmania martiniquensis]